MMGPAQVTQVTKDDGVTETWPLGDMCKLGLLMSIHMVLLLLLYSLSYIFLLFLVFVISIHIKVAFY